jgi:hypothetical protein
LRIKAEGWKIKIENGFWKLVPFSIFNFSIEKKRPGDGYCEIRFKTILAFTCWLAPTANARQ